MSYETRYLAEYVVDTCLADKYPAINRCFEVVGVPRRFLSSKEKINAVRNDRLYEAHTALTDDSAKTVFMYQGATPATLRFCKPTKVIIRNRFDTNELGHGFLELHNCEIVGIEQSNDNAMQITWELDEDGCEKYLITSCHAIVTVLPIKKITKEFKAHVPVLIYKQETVSAEKKELLFKVKQIVDNFDLNIKPKDELSMRLYKVLANHPERREDILSGHYVKKSKKMKLYFDIASAEKRN